MPWASNMVIKRFKTLVERVADFHGRFGKDRNQKAFDEISLILNDCLSMCLHERLPAEHPNPKEKQDDDEKVENLSPKKRKEKNIEVVGAFQYKLYQAFTGVTAEKSGGADNADFNNMLMQIATLTAEFIAEASVCIRKNVEEIIPGVKESKGRVTEELRERFTKIRPMDEIDTDPTKIIIDIPEIDVQEEDQERAGAVKELRLIISDLKLTPAISGNCQTLFGRAVNHAVSYNPKIALTGITLVSSGLSYASLSTFSEYVGPMLDQLISADETKFTHKYVFAAAFVVMGGSILTALMCKSWPKQQKVVKEVIHGEPDPINDDLERGSIKYNRV